MWHARPCHALCETPARQSPPSPVYTGELPELCAVYVSFLYPLGSLLLFIQTLLRSLQETFLQHQSA